jgi:AcrR family transcriptional regulator
MTRVSKAPEERREELVNIAEQLFIEFGYEDTAVSDIVKKAKVAQGTFYYYFKSKDEVLDAVIEKMINEITNALKNIVLRDDLNAVEKMLGFFKFFKTLGQDREKLTDYLHEERNAPLHLKLEKKMYPEMIPVFTKLVEQGIAEGLFTTKYPEIASMAIMASIGKLTEGQQNHTLRSTPDPELIIAIIDLMERILGAKSGTIMKYASMMEGGK